MGLNDAPDQPNPPQPPSPGADADRLDDLAAYALDAVGTDEGLGIEALLAADRDATEIELHFRDAAGAYASATPDIDLRAPAELRDRVLRAAHERRAPSPVDPASAIDVHRIEAERAVMLLRRLDDAQWTLPLDPPEFAGWTIRDLAAHLASNEGLAAQSLGVGSTPETVTDNEQRSAAVLARHRDLTPAETVDELERLILAVDAAVRGLDTDDLQRTVPWWAADMSIQSMLIIRAFEIWTHADDIRRACGLPHLPPPAPSLLTMSSLASGWSGLMLSINTAGDYTGKSVELHFTGLGGGQYHVNLGFDDVDLTAATPDAVITLDLVDYCRALGDRIPEGGLDYQATGDLELARELVGSLNALATL